MPFYGNDARIMLSLFQANNEEEENMKTKELCMKGLLIALVTVSTMVLQIPVSATQGYIHLGDGIILLTSVFFGWKYGMVAGGVGSMLADVLSGYSHWAPFTLLIKGLMGFIIGKTADYTKEKNVFFTARNIVASVLGSAWMVVGYLLGGTILKGSFVVALTSVPENIVQAVGGLVIYLVVGFAFSKVNVCKYISVE